MITPKLLCISLMLVISSCTAPAFAQNMHPKQKANVRLANEDRTTIQVKTIVANPKLVSAKPSCEVTSFVISFQPEGGTQTSPLRTEGSSIKPEHIKYLQEHASENVKIFFEHIHMSCNGQDITEAPIVITSFP